jgi:hypothetical protein
MRFPLLTCTVGFWCGKAKCKKQKTHWSMIAISGATSPAAHEALTASAPSRRPRFLVFQFVRTFSVIFCRGASARLGLSLRSGTGNATAGASRVGLPSSFMARNE